MAETVRNSSEQTDSDEFLTNQFVGIISLEKRIRRNFFRPSDNFLTNTKKRHSDELPTIFRCGHTRPEFIGKTIYRRTTVRPKIPTNEVLGKYRRTTVRRKIPTDKGSSENSDEPLSVGIFRGHRSSVQSDALNSSEYINFKYELILHFYIYFLY